MDVWQLGRQLAYLLRTTRWADSPADLVLTGGAVVSEDREGNFLPGDFLPDGPESLTLPFARVSSVGPTELDSFTPGRIQRATFRAWVTAGGGGIAGASGTNDSHGIDQVTGANRAASNGQGKSQGRDVDELIGRLIESGLGSNMLVDSTHGMQGEVLGIGSKVPVDGVQILSRPIEIAAYNATVARFYHTCRQLTYYTTVGLDDQVVVNLAWVNAPTRFDTLRNIVRRASSPGGAAPSSPSGGTAVTVSGGDLGTTATITGLASGTYGVSHFVAYDETGSGNEERYSRAYSISVVV